MRHNRMQKRLVVLILKKHGIWWIAFVMHMLKETF